MSIAKIERERGRERGRERKREREKEREERERGESIIPFEVTASV